jgi:hypothetical protein
MLNRKDAAAYIGQSTKSLWKHAQTGRIPFVMVGRRRMYREVDLDRFLAGLPPLEGASAGWAKKPNRGAFNRAEDRRLAEAKAREVEARTKEERAYWHAYIRAMMIEAGEIDIDWSRVVDGGEAYMEALCVAAGIESATWGGREGRIIPTSSVSFTDGVKDPESVFAAKYQGARESMADGERLAREHLGHPTREHGEWWWWEERGR